MVTRILGLLGLNIILFTGAAYIYLSKLPASTAHGNYRWEAVNPMVAEGPNQPITVRLVGPDGKTVRDATVAKLRLDMAPDDMAAMDTPLRPDPGAEPGTFGYRADLSMAGQWALHISGTVPGHSQAVEDSVIFTASGADKPQEAQNNGRTIAYYRNPMGLPDTSPVPKKDEMGMDYIAVYADELETPEGTTNISSKSAETARIKTAVAGPYRMHESVRVAGTTVPDEARTAIVSTRFDGFIDELYVQTTGTAIKAGTPLAKIWIESPEILQRQADYIALLKASKGKDTPEIVAAESNLLLFGLPAEAIATVKSSREPARTFILKSQVAGTVVEKNAVQGMRFRSGDMLFRTVDLSTLWVMASVPERDLGLVREGQDANVSLNAFPGELIAGRVLFVNPELDPSTRTAGVRIAVNNATGAIKTNLLAVVEIKTTAKEVIAVPRSAVLDSGQQQVVVVRRKDGLFESRAVKCGRSDSEYTEILEGIAVGESVVVNGNFLIDSESNLRAALKTLSSTPAQP